MSRKSKLSPIERADAYLAVRGNQPPRDGDKIKLHNQTEWHLGDIRRLCERVCDEMKVSRNRMITVVYSRSVFWGCSGWAHYNSRTILMRVPRPPGPKKYVAQAEFPVLDFARVLEHEIQHNLGLEHHSMSACGGLRQHPGMFPWVGEYHVRGPKVSAKPAKDKVAVRAKAASAALERWESKLKRAQNGVKKARAKVSYYARTTQAKAACVPQTEEQTK